MRLLSAGSTKPISSVAFAGDGAHLAAADHGGAVRVWDVAAGAVAHRLDVEVGRFPPTLVRVALSPDGGTLAVAGIQVDLADGSRAALPTPRRWPTPFRGVAFSPDGGLLAAAGDQWRWWDVASRAAIPRPTFPWRAGVWRDAWPAVAFSPDGARLAAAQAASVEGVSGGATRYTSTTFRPGSWPARSPGWGMSRGP